MQAGGHRFDPGQLHQVSAGISVHLFKPVNAAIAESSTLTSPSDLDGVKLRAFGKSATQAGPNASSMRLRAQRLNRASKIFDNRIDWVVVTTRLSGALAFELKCQRS